MQLGRMGGRRGLGRMALFAAFVACCSVVAPVGAQPPLPVETWPPDAPPIYPLPAPAPPGAVAPPEFAPQFPLDPPIAPRVPPLDEIWPASPEQPEGVTVKVAPLTEQDLDSLRTADAALLESTAVWEARRELDLETLDPTRPAPPPKNLSASAFRGVFYDNDFRYLNSPDASPSFLGDWFKQIPMGSHWMIDLGGEYRLRQHNEAHLRFTDLTGRSDNFLLERTRLYGNFNYDRVFRFYGEAIDATSNWQDYSPRGIEVNRFDALNLFVDGLLSSPSGGEWWLRGGRQELLYGEQRLISPLDWANTRRTFDGMKTFYRSEPFDIDAFWTRPVPFAQHLPHDHNFDQSADRQEFYGIYSSYKAIEKTTIDAYYLGASDFGPVTSITQTFGGRWKTNHDGWLAEVEGGYQFGRLGAADRSAGFYVVGGGREMSRLPWSPTLWIYYDWASGDRDPGDGQRNTFNQLFPLSHKYFGFADLVARENIRDLNFQLVSKPTERHTLLLWWHIFHLDQARDALYNAPGVPIRFDPTGAAGTDVGQELDLTLTYAINARTELLFGYSHFWAGNFVLATNPPGVSGDVDFFYTQLQWRF